MHTYTGDGPQQLNVELNWPLERVGDVAKWVEASGDACSRTVAAIS